MATITKPLIVIVGQTASGKTALAVDLALRFDGEVICADSRTVYKGMNIGTAKPRLPEMKGVPHHLLDIIDPDQAFNVSDFKRLADRAITDIQGRGKLPILVGGSGLYINSVIYNYDFADSKGPRDELNPRHLAGDLPKPEQRIRPNTLVLGIDIEPDILKTRIIKRVEDSIDQGLIDEAAMLSQKYGWDIPSMQSPAYKGIKEYIDGTLTLDEAVDKNVLYDSRLAKKQRTWFRRNNSIQWMADPSESVEIVTTFLNTP